MFKGNGALPKALPDWHRKIFIALMFLSAPCLMMDLGPFHLHQYASRIKQ